MPSFRSIPIRFIVAGSICLSLLILAAILNLQSLHNARQESMNTAISSVSYLTDIIKLSMQTQTIPMVNSLNYLDLEKISGAKNTSNIEEHLPLIIEALKRNPLSCAVFLGYESGELIIISKAQPHSFLLSGTMPEHTAFVMQSITLRPDSSYISTTSFYDANLNILEKRPTPDFAIDPRTRPWYVKAKNENDTVFTPPYAFYPTKQPGVIIAKKMSGGNGVLGIGTITKDLNGIFNSMLITPGTQIMMVDDEGTIIANSDGMLANIKTKDPKIIEMDHPIFQQLFSKPKKNTTAKIIRNGSSNWYVLSSQFTAASGNIYTVLVAIPEKELLADAWSNIYKQLLSSAVIVFLLMVLGWCFGSRVVAPLRRLTDQATALKNFNYVPPKSITSRIKEVRELKVAFGDMSQTINTLLNILLILNKEQDLEIMLSRVLKELLQLVHLKSGAIYLYDHKSKTLQLAVQEGRGHQADLEITNAEASDQSLLDQLKNAIGNAPLISVLRNRKQELIGLLYIDQRGSYSERNDVILQDQSFIKFVQTVSGAAAIAIETRQHILSQRAMLKSFIKLLAGAIDAKSHYTGGHCLRVPELSIMLIEALQNHKESPYPAFHMNQYEEEEFRIAAWLHDCGKIITPEHVVDKATKLECIYNRIHEIRTRFEILYRDAHIAYLESIVRGDAPEKATSERDKAIHSLQEDFAFIGKCNIGGESMDKESLQRLQNIAEKKWFRHFEMHHGLSSSELERLANTDEINKKLPAEEKLLADKYMHIIPWLGNTPPVKPDDKDNIWGFDMQPPKYLANLGELYNLSIRRGTLTDEERFIINGHIIQTIIMLSSLDLPKNLQRVPDIAGNHHEKIDGTGYPRKIATNKLGIAERVVAIADVFEALTAADRPYKDGKTLSESLRILSNMGKEGHLDAKLVNFFINSGIYINYAQLYMQQSQIDSINPSDYLIQITPDIN